MTCEDISQELDVEVAYASETKQFLKSLRVAQGTRVIDAVRQSGVGDEFPELDIESARLGIFSRIVAKDVKLNQHDRVEIYRSLRVDPKEARRRRAGKSTR